MQEIHVGDLVTVTNNPYTYAYPKEGEAYRVSAIRGQVGERPLYEVVVPNDLDEDSIPFWDDEIRKVEVSAL